MGIEFEIYDAQADNTSIQSLVGKSRTWGVKDTESYVPVTRCVAEDLISRLR